MCVSIDLPQADIFDQGGRRNGVYVRTLPNAQARPKRMGVDITAVFKVSFVYKCYTLIYMFLFLVSNICQSFQQSNGRILFSDCPTEISLVAAQS